jgi:hypothetical protein
VRKDDYAKWMLDDPRINFAISQRGSAAGVNHLGLQVESAAELAAVRAQFEAADAATTLAEPGASCCYAKSDKHWVTDPQGIAWEASTRSRRSPTSMAKRRKRRCQALAVRRWRRNLPSRAPAALRQLLMRMVRAAHPPQARRLRHAVTDRATGGGARP